MTTLTKESWKDPAKRKKTLLKIYREAEKPQKEPSELQKSIGAAIVEKRKSKMWTQQRLADESGIERTQIARVENGKVNVSVDTLLRVAKALGCRLEVNFVRLKNDKDE